MSRFQPIYDIAELCAQRGVTNVVLCPGSRCAPLTLAFVRHTLIIKRTFSDERSAGFIAMGMAQQTKRPSVLVCTSGSAAYNFAPAVAEAFFSQTPLLVFTADRPNEWIAQHDGQTIYQSEIFGKHVKKSYSLPIDYEHPDSAWAINRMVNEAINLALQEPAGPVHINAPFREPLYPTADDTFRYTESVRCVNALNANDTLTPEQQSFMATHIKKYHKIALVAGQHDHDSALLLALENVTRNHTIPLIADVITNLHPLDKIIRHADAFLGQASDEVKRSLQPDLIITFGKSVISKNLKVFLRKYKPKAHWHIQPAGTAADTFQSITQIIHASPTSCFSFLSELIPVTTFEHQKQNNFFNLWEVEERRMLRTLNGFFPHEPFGEMELVSEVIQRLPEGANLHLANSMSVRYANYVGLTAAQKNIKVFANRGTSGIDGCTSTVIGHCLNSDTLNVLITGDLAFFYDRNAFWHNYPLPNLRVVVLNNHGGIIFGMIDGPGTLPEAGEYFVTRQRLNALKLCEEFGFTHLKLDHKRKLKHLLNDFFDVDGHTKVLELESDTTLNKTIFDNLKQQIKKSYEP